MRRVVALVALVVLTIAVASCSSSGGTSGSEKPAVSLASTTTAPERPAIRLTGWAPAPAPANAGKANVSWFRGARDQLIAVALPEGPPPWPVVAYYHGGSGLFANELDTTARLANAGFAVVSGCWNAGLPDGVQCPMVVDPGVAAGAILAFAKRLPGGDPNRLATMGVSSGVAPAVVMPDPRIKAIVADSGLTASPVDVVAPILVLSGKLDERPDGIQKWANDLRTAGETVESNVIDKSGHVVTLEPTVEPAVTAEVVDFLRRQLHVS